MSGADEPADLIDIRMGDERSVPSDARAVFAVFHAAGYMVGKAAGFAHAAAAHIVFAFDFFGERRALSACSADFEPVGRIFGAQGGNPAGERLKKGVFQMICFGDFVKGKSGKHSAEEPLDFLEQHDEDLLFFRCAEPSVVNDQFMQFVLVQ